MIVLRLGRHPTRLDSPRAQIIDDLLEMTEGQHEAVDMIVEMIDDFRHKGLDSRFVKKLKGPLWELKSRARGGMKGGARVYFVWLHNDEVGLCRAECKPDERPDMVLLNWSVDVYIAYRNGVKVFT